MSYNSLLNCSVVISA